MKRFEGAFDKLQHTILTRESTKERNTPHRLVTFLMVSAAYVYTGVELVRLLKR